jgi:hypothetical protein
MVAAASSRANSISPAASMASAAGGAETIDRPLRRTAAGMAIGFWGESRLEGYEGESTDSGVAGSKEEVCVRARREREDRRRRKGGRRVGAGGRGGGEASGGGPVG